MINLKTDINSIISNNDDNLNNSGDNDLNLDTLKDNNLKVNL